jgi:hypothetical protein
MSCDRTGGVWLPGHCVPAGRDDGGGTAGGDGHVALPSVEGAVCGDAFDLLMRRDLVEEFGQHWRVADVAAGELCSRDLQCLLVHPNVDLAPDAPFRAAALTGVPLAFALDLDAGTVDEKL